MDRQSHLARLALQFSRLSADGDWHALGELDSRLAALLQEASKQQWTPAERVVLEKLQRAHEQARERCDRETDRIEAGLAQMRERKDGWMAYAMSVELEEDRA